jgi:large subunit ribosomal protein L35Ae
MVKAIVIQFRRGRKTYTPRHFLIEVEGCDSREKAKKFVGKTVEWTSSGKDKITISEKVASPHGNKGVIRAIFERGLPGQAIGTEVKFSEK